MIAGVVDGINGVTKTKLTSATARKLLDPDDGMDVKKLDASTIRKGKKVSLARNCARWLDLEGSEGTKITGSQCTHSTGDCIAAF